MAETPDSESVPSSSENVLTEDKTEDGPTPEKRRKVDDKEQIEKLEQRLGGILCCAVCLDLPQAAVYQCSNGHLMCAPCFTHLLADARLRDEAATCPNCRIEISKTSASRNLAVEKTVSELPSECKYCTCVFPRHSLQHHEEKICEERVYKFSQIVVDSSLRRRQLIGGLVRIVAVVYCLIVSMLRRTYFVSQVSEAVGKRRRFCRLTGCTYAGLGCGWVGPWHEAHAHAEGCALPTRRARDVLPALAQRDAAHRDALAVYAQLVDLLSYEKITFNDLQLKPYRTEEYVHKLYYETARFSAFGHQWVVKAFVNNNQRDPQHSAHRDITYQRKTITHWILRNEGTGGDHGGTQSTASQYHLIMKSKPVCSVNVQWVALRGPYGEAGVEARVATHVFSEAQPEAPALPLPLADPKGANRLLANKAIHFRLIMFLSSK